MEKLPTSGSTYGATRNLTALKHSVRSARVSPDLECGGPPDAADVSTASKHASTESTQSSIAPPPPPYSLAPAKARRRWREDFYDHFLDGAAGVMYTSFLGLILDDLIALGTGKYKKVDTYKYSSVFIER